MIFQKANKKKNRRALRDKLISKRCYRRVRKRIKYNKLSKLHKKSHNRLNKQNRWEKVLPVKVSHDKNNQKVELIRNSKLSKIMIYRNWHKKKQINKSIRELGIIKVTQ